MFILKFKSMDDMIKVVEEGAWAIKGQPFFMKKWTKS